MSNTKNINLTLFTPHPGQKSIIDGFADSKHKFGVVSTGRQFGKSLLGQNLLLYWLLKNKKSKGAWISPVYMQATKVFKELSNTCHQLIKADNKSELSIEFINGSTLKFLSADNYDSIRGFSFDYMVIDEAAFIKKEAINEAILPTLTVTGKKCLIISTPKSKNWFYNYWMLGSEPNEIYTSFTAISEANPYVDKKFIEEQKKTLPTEVFDQEFLAKFSDSGNDVFKNLSNVCILDQFPKTTEKCVAGIDTGMSGDYSVLAIFSLSGELVDLTRVNNKSIQDIATQFTSVLKRYNTVKILVESNGIGVAMYENIRKVFGNKVENIHTSQDSKLEQVRLLISDIQEEKIKLPSEQLVPELTREFSNYTYKLSGNGKLSFSHPSGGHDDIVDAVAMANLLRHRPLPTQSIYVGTRR